MCCLVVQHSLLQEHGSSRESYLPQLTVSDRKTLSCVNKYLWVATIFILNLIIYFLCIFFFCPFCTFIFFCTWEKRKQIIVFIICFSHVISVNAWPIFPGQKESRRTHRQGVPQKFIETLWNLCIWVNLQPVLCSVEALSGPARNLL